MSVIAEPGRRTGPPSGRAGRAPGRRQAAARRNLHRRRSLFAALALTLAAAGLPPVVAVADVRVEDVKAAFVAKLLRYTEWPATSFEAAESPFVVIVIGDDAVAGALEEIAERSAPIAGRPLSVEPRRLPGRGSWRYARLLEELQRSHLLYLGEEVTEGNAAELIEDLEGAAVLTVGDRPGFAEAGGMIGLRRSGGRVAFDANPGAIKKTRLVVSARVLRLARIVGGPETRS